MDRVTERTPLKFRDMACSI